MTAAPIADALVVGAGPAGAVTAAALARHGMKVLLVGAETTSKCRAGGYDVLVTGQALGMLAAAGMDRLIQIRPVDLVELRFGTSASRSVTDSGAGVCDWRAFRRALREVAIQAGAHYLRGTVTAVGSDLGLHQAVIDCGRRQVHVAAKHAVVSVGGGSQMLVPSDRPVSPGLVCARRYSGARLGNRVILSLPAPSATATTAEVTCVWALPGEDDIVTVGTALAAHGDAVCPEQLQDDALRVLANADPRFTGLTPVGGLHSAPLYAGFHPDRAMRVGCLLVGDAAGLVNPFTGEGLSAAVHTASRAASAIIGNPDRPVAARRAHARQLVATFAGCLGTTRYAARRYHLTWRILAAGADSDHPFFAKGRRALLLPEGPAGLASLGRLDIADPDAVCLTPFLAACDEVAISVVREQWPFLARLALVGESFGQPRLRSATLLFAALVAEGGEPPVAAAPLGAAIELAFLGASSLFGSSGGAAVRRGVDWALAATLLAGDFLLAQASRLVATYAPQAAWSFADWLAELARIRAARIDRRSTVPAGTVPAGAVFGSLLEFPVRMGALLSAASPATTRALRDFGRHCGFAFLHAEDILAVRGMRTRLDTTLDVMLRERMSAIPDYVPGLAVSGTILASDERLRSTVLRAASTACRQAQRDALALLDGSIDPVACRILRNFVQELTACALSTPDDSVLTEPMATIAATGVATGKREGGA
jgi:menaquinone-9 beta-reductase